MEIKLDTSYKNKSRKKTPEELEQYMFFKRRGFAINGKRGRGSYKRKQKYPQKFEEQ